MAKYSEASEEIEKLVDEIAGELGLSAMGVDFQPICVGKAKEVCKVVKANELAEYASQREDLVFVVCYEEAFDLVDEKTQYMWLRKEMENVSYDSEKSKLIIGSPTVTIPIGFYEKYGKEGIDVALLGHYTIASLADKKKQEKEAEKLNKKSRKKNKY